MDVETGYVTGTNGSGRGKWHTDRDCRSLTTAVAVYEKPAERLDEEYERCSYCLGDGNSPTEQDFSYQEDLLRAASEE